MKIFMTSVTPGYLVSRGTSLSPSWGPVREAIRVQRERLAVCGAFAGSKHASTLDVDVPTNPSATSGGVT